MARTISIRELRQNPTRMLREVKDGATYTVTDRGRPIASVAGVHETRWVPSEDVDALLRELGSDAAWEEEIARDRAAQSAADPWDQG